jgi:hypothetical protein
MVLNVGGMRWRPAVQPNEMRNSLRSFVESVSYTRSGGNRDAIGPGQRMLWYGAAPTSRQAARVVEGDVISMDPNHDAKIDFLAPDRLEKGVQ